MAKFPNVIHVTREGEGEDAYWQVNADGVFSLDVPGQPVGIYKLVEVGRVKIQKSFQSKKKR